ncbi:MAG TPA: ATP-binding protein [Stellaceae bacterium]|nr:ATP-binding protein [Stellaceae bacterium]
MLVLALGQSTLERWLAGWEPNARQVVSGIWFGVNAAIAMLLAVRLGIGALLDVRVVVLMGAMAFAGPVAGVIAMLMAMVVRAGIGGETMPVGLGLIVTSAALGYALVRIRRPERSVIWPLAYGLIGSLGQMAWLLPMTWEDPRGWDRVLATVREGGPVLLTSSMLGFALLSFVISRERERIERERRLGAILDWTPLFIGLLDPDGRVLQANRTALDFVGAKAGDMEGKPFWHTAWCSGDPEVGERFRSAVAQAAGGKTARFEVELAGTGGRCRTFDFQLYPVRDNAGRVAMVLPEGRDVTAQKEAEQRLEEAEESLRHAQKMEAVGQLTGGIAHDFNNILAIVGGNLELMRRHPLAEEVRRLVDAALRAVSRGGTLTQHLLAFSRRQHLTPTVVSMNEIAADTAAMLRRILGDSIVVRAELAHDLRLGYFDPHQLETALLNLAINARDAMPNGGTLTISTGNACFEYAMSDDAPPGDYLRLAVRDTGIGMSQEVLRRAFEPFFTTKPVGRGSGLGLSMVYGFIKQSGGHIELQSIPGRGTIIVIYLPAAQGFEVEELAEKAATPVI